MRVVDPEPVRPPPVGYRPGIAKLGTDPGRLTPGDDDRTTGLWHRCLAPGPGLGYSQGDN